MKEDLSPKATENVTYEDDNAFSLQVLIPRVIAQQPKEVTDDINIDGITISSKGTDLLCNASLKLQKGRRYGLIGKNGIGKTTLLKCIAKGSIKGTYHFTICYSTQEFMFDYATWNTLYLVLTFL